MADAFMNAVGTVMPHSLSLRSRLGGKGEKSMADTVLFVTAHPDDETMFFAPAILR